MGDSSEGDRSPHDVAVVGMAGRFPGAASVAEFWRNLCEGRESIRSFSEEELRASGMPEALSRNPAYVPARGILDDVQHFDAEFFGYSAAEAERAGPQQRLFLEGCWEALEGAGYAPDRYPGRIGLFAGAPEDSYLSLVRHQTATGQASKLLDMLGNSSAFLTTQVSYRLGLRGPSVAIQTACSTSLVAVHLACQSLINRECDLALAGGVSISVPQAAGYLYQEGGILSPDGHCRAFDASAAGTVPGDGLGVVVLKRLDEALAGGDHVHAVIRGSAINNDGSAKVGFTAPSVDGQAEVIAEALAVAGFNPESMGYVQAHGTGTALGDPAEVAGLRQAFDTDRRRYCAIGSVKANIGHLNSAAGVVGLIAAVLALEHECIPPALHFERPSPACGLDESPFYVNTSLKEWPRGESPRRAGVSSFGIGGTNAHVALEEAPRAVDVLPGSPWHLLLLSARTPAALESSMARLAAHLRERPHEPLADVAHTLRIGRRAFAHRCAVVCRGMDDAVAALNGNATGGLVRGEQPSEQPRIVFMFPGEEAPYLGMGGELCRTEPVFRQELDRCLDLLTPLVGQSLRDVFNLEASVGGQVGPWGTRLGQGVLFAVEYALARLWQSWGVQPAAVTGHGVGEYVAACIAGVFELDDALRLVALRGCLMQELPLPESSAAFTDAIRQCLRSPPRLPLLSSLTGAWMTADQAADPEYWTRHAQPPARFAGGCGELLADSGCSFLEVGPGRTLQSLVRQAPGGAERLVVGTLPGPGDDEPDRAVFLKGLGILWTAGVPLDWSGFDGGGRRRVPLPTYPFERQRYWLERAGEPAEIASLGGSDPEDWLYVPGWRRSIPVECLALPPETLASRAWLVFQDTAGLADLVAQKLRQRGCGVVTVVAADRFERVSERSFAVRPRHPEDYRSLFEDLARDGTVLQGIAHVWGLEGAGSNGEAFDPDGLEQAFGFFSLLFLAQAIGDASRPPYLRLEVISTGLFSVTGQEPLSPARATVLGPCRVIPQEYAGVSCRVYDVEPIGGEREQERLAESLVAEFVSEARNGTVVYRHGSRWIPTFERLPRSRGELRTPFREDGAYVVTGGGEDPALAVAEHLADKGAKDLVLVSQAAASSVGAEGQMSTAGAAGRMSARLAALEAKGVRVVVEPVDAADLPAMKGVVARARTRSGRIRGAVHAGRAPSEGLLQFKTAETVARVLATKAGGAWALQGALETQALDFLVLFGSSTGIIGGVGQADDCGANAFLDSFACARAARGCAGTLVLDLPPWRSETEGEHPPQASRLPAMAREIGERMGITVAQGMAALDRALATGLPQIVVSRFDFEAVVESQSRFTAAQLLGQLRTGDNSGRRRGRPTWAGAYVPPANDTEAAIARVWEQVLGFEPIGSTDDFFEMGGHSLLAIDMVSRLREFVGAEISLGLVFEFSVLAGLARAVADEAPRGEDPEQFEMMLREVERLSPEEATRLLHAERAAASVEAHSTEGGAGE